MSRHKNLITGVEYNTANELVDSLAAEFAELLKKEAEIDLSKAEYVSAIDALAGNPSKTKGTITVDGTEYVFKVERRENVSYPRDRGQENPLADLVRKYDLLGSMISIEIKEKGSEIEKLLAKYNSEPEELTVEQREVAAALTKIRQVKQGTPGVKVELQKGKS